MAALCWSLYPRCLRACLGRVRPRLGHLVALGALAVLAAFDSAARSCASSVFSFGASLKAHLSFARGSALGPSIALLELILSSASSARGSCAPELDVALAERSLAF